MKQNIVVFMVSTIIMLSSSATSNAIEFTTKNVTDNTIEDDAPQINSSGQLAWHGFDGNDNEIFFFDGSETHQLADNEVDLQLNDNGQLLWRASIDSDHEIFVATYEPGQDTYGDNHNSDDDDDENTPASPSGGGVGSAGCFITSTF